MVTSKGHTAGFFGSIDEIARASVPYFLTKDDITGYYAPKMNGSNAKCNKKAAKGCYDKSLIVAGTVLRYLGVYEDISAFILNSSSSSAHKNSLRSRKAHLPEHGARYAKCVSMDDSNGGQVVFVPITESGR